MHGYTRGALSEQIPYFRTEEFSQINIECMERLRRLAGAPDDTHVYLLACSGTGAMEAVVAGCFSGAHDRLLVIDGGSFGRRFAEIATHHEIPHEAATFSFGETLKLDVLDAAIGSAEGFTGMLVNIHETSTGQLYDRGMLASFCGEHGLYFVCDAIGSFLADPLDFEKDGIDALIISSQKALALPPGLSAVILSDRLFRKMSDQGIKPFSYYFDFKQAEENAVRGQTPFTPPVGIIMALRERLERIENEGGTEASVARTKELAKDFRERLKPLIERKLVVLSPYVLSNACTPLVFINGGAKDACQKLSQNGVWLNPNGGPLEDVVLRVGHLGDLTLDDNAMLVEMLSDILL